MHLLAYAILTYWAHHLTHPWKLNSYATLQSVVRGQGEGTNWPDVSSNHAFKDHMSPIPPDNQTVHNMLRRKKKKKNTKLRFHPLNFENFFIYLFFVTVIFLYIGLSNIKTLYIWVLVSNMFEKTLKLSNKWYYWPKKNKIYRFQYPLTQWQLHLYVRVDRTTLTCQFFYFLYT